MLGGLVCGRRNESNFRTRGVTNCIRAKPRWKCGNKVMCEAKCYNAGIALGATSWIRTSHFFNPTSSGATILISIRPLRGCQGFKWGRLISHIPTSGKNGNFVWLMRLSPTTTQHQLIHKLLGGLWWVSGPFVFGGPLGGRRDGWNFRTRGVTNILKRKKKTYNQWRLY